MYHQHCKQPGIRSGEQNDFFQAYIWLTLPQKDFVLIHYEIRLYNFQMIALWVIFPYKITQLLQCKMFRIWDAGMHEMLSRAIKAIIWIVQTFWITFYLYHPTQSYVKRVRYIINETACLWMWRHFNSQVWSIKELQPAMTVCRFLFLILYFQMKRSLGSGGAPLQRDTRPSSLTLSSQKPFLKMLPHIDYCLATLSLHVVLLSESFFHKLSIYKWQYNI